MPAIVGFLGYDPFPPPATLAERLLQARRKNGWSTGEAASQLGVDRTTWQDWERGELILFRKHRAKVAELLGLD
jgi:transcriptional regulator with XRE-family HTH domain